VKLTFINRIKICYEVIFIVSGHSKQTAQEKQLSTFQRGYDAGRIDQKLEDEEDV
jgi:hypothetical protein